MEQAHISNPVQSAELQPGSTLLQGQYTIDRFLNSGGFGITYLARDSLNRPVVIKECYPQTMCHRIGANVYSRSEQQRAQFKSIVRHFVREAHRLATLDHPNIVGVHQVFEDNETAYMALDFVDGDDLSDNLDHAWQIINPGNVKSLLLTLLDAVSFVHSNGLLHCDISPDNILVDQQGKPVLIDFGAARENKTATGRVLSSLMVVKEGYSPQEFYLKGSDQGPYSDLYALAASFYHLISGQCPPNSQIRLAALAGQKPDPYQPLGNLKQAAGYGKEFTQAIDRALQLLPENRFQSAEEWTLCIDASKRKEAALALAQSDEGIACSIRKLVAEANVEPDSELEPAPEVQPEPEERAKQETRQVGIIGFLASRIFRWTGSTRYKRTDEVES